MAEGSFIRVFHEDLIEHHKDVWDDVRALGTFVHLLARADKLWPTPADLPRRVSKSALEACVKSGLVTLKADHCYSIKGLDALRKARSKAAKEAAEERWRQERADAERNAGGNAGRIADGNASAMPRARAQSGLPVSGDSSSQSVEEGTLRARGISVPVKGMNGSVTEVTFGQDNDVRRLQALADELTQQPYSMANVHGGLGAKAVNEQLRPHGFDRVERAWRKVAVQVRTAGTPQPTLRQLVLGADDVLNPVPQADSRDQREEEARAAYDRRVERTQKEIAAYRISGTAEAERGRP